MGKARFAFVVFAVREHKAMSFFYQLSPFQLIVFMVGAVLGHIALFLASRRVNPVYVLASLVLVLAPFSGASELGAGGAGGMAVKWIRGYVLVLLLVLGLLKHRRGTLGAASQVWLAFAALFVLSGLWSDVLLRALTYKVQFGLVVLAGLLLASTVRDRKELIKGLRVLGVAAGVMGAFIFVYFLTHEHSSLRFGRITILGANANRIAMNFGALLLVCTYLGLNERSTFWKAVAFACCGALAMVVVLTGSRGTTAAVILGFLIQVVPQGGRRIHVVMVPVFLACVAVMSVDIVGSEVEVTRFLSTRDTRTEGWHEALKMFQAKPLIGLGWAHHADAGLSPRELHSIYVQVAVEMGLLGLTVFGVCLAVLAQRGIQMYRFARRQAGFSRIAILPISLVGAALLDGLVGSATLYPSSFAMMMALGVGLIDRFPQMAILEKRRALRLMAHENARRKSLCRSRISDPQLARRR